MDSKRPDTAPDEAGRTAKRTPRTRSGSSTPEWRRIEAFADRRGLTGPEFVRFAALAAMEEAPAAPDSCDRLAPADLSGPSATPMCSRAPCAAGCSTGAARRSSKSWSPPPARCRTNCWATAQPSERGRGAGPRWTSPSGSGALPGTSTALARATESPRDRRCREDRGSYSREPRPCGGDALEYRGPKSAMLQSIGAGSPENRATQNLK